MLRRMCRAKIHRATITASRLDYEGSIEIDQNLMDAAGLLEHEVVLVANLANGHRFETYCIKGLPKTVIEWSGSVAWKPKLLKRTNSGEISLHCALADRCVDLRCDRCPSSFDKGLCQLVKQSTFALLELVSQRGGCKWL